MRNRRLLAGPHKAHFTMALSTSKLSWFSLRSGIHRVKLDLNGCTRSPSKPVIALRKINAPTSIVRCSRYKPLAVGTNATPINHLASRPISTKIPPKTSTPIPTEKPQTDAAEEGQFNQVLPSKLPIPFVPLAITAVSAIPFVACSIIPFAFPFEIAGKALFMQMTFSAVSLSMLGSVHWGLALSEYKRIDGMGEQALANPLVKATSSDQLLRYVGGALPGLAAWMFMTQPPLVGMVGLMAGFAALALFEMGAHKARLLPSWYIRLRTPWTVTVLLSLGINLIHLL